MRQVRLITLAGDPQREPEIAAAITREESLELILRCVDRVESLAALRGGSVDLALAVGPVGWFDFQCLQEARAQGVRVLGLAGDPVEVEMLEVAGIEVVPAHRTVAELADIVRETSLLPIGAEAEVPDPGRVLAVWGAKGAPGRTSVAIELAATLAVSEPSTLLVDADLYGGDLTQLLGVVEEIAGLVPFARRGAKGELRADAWAEDLLRIGSKGPVLLPGLLRAELWEEVSPFGWCALLEAARDAFRFTVVDVGFCLEQDRSGGGPARGRNEVARATVSAADQVVVVVRADPVGVRTFLWALNEVRDLELRERLLVVLNRVRPGESRQLRSILRRHLGRAPVAEIPDRPDLFARALWDGRSVTETDPDADVADEVRNLAAAAGASIPPRGFLTRLAGRAYVR